MATLNNLTIGKKLGLGFALAGIAAMVLGVGGIMNLRTVESVNSKFYNDIHQPSIQLIEGNLAAARSVYMLATLSTRNTDQENQETYAKFQEFAKATVEGFSGAAESAVDDNHREAMEDYVAWYNDEFVTRAERVYASLEAGNETNTAEIREDALAQVAQLREYSNTAREGFAKAATASYKQIQATTDRAKSTTIVILLFAVITSAFTAAIVTRNVTHGVGEVKRAAEGLALGDANQSVRYEGKDEIAQMAEAFRKVIAYQKGLSISATSIASGDLTTSVEPKSAKDTLGIAFADMVASLRKQIGAVQVTASVIQEASDHLAQATMENSKVTQDIAHAVSQVTLSTDQSNQTISQLAMGSEQLARDATQAAAAVDEMSRSVDQMGRAGAEQVQAAIGAAQTAKTGGAAVGETIDRLGDIRERVTSTSEIVRSLGEKQARIGAIVQTIEGIAEQTNLLALNAAIEAARAGDHGRGFAVVADEVRKLAESSGTATKEIATLIEEVRQSVENSITAMESSASQVYEVVEHSSSARTALVDIVDTIEKLSTLIKGNEKLIRSMSENSSRVASLVNNVAAVSQESAAGAEEIAAAGAQVAASTQEVSAATEEQSANMEEVSAMADELRESAKRLFEVTGQFILEADTATSRPRKAA